jgi:hypothetical protein
MFSKNILRVRSSGICYDIIANTLTPKSRNVVSREICYDIIANISITLFVCSAVLGGSQHGWGFPRQGQRSGYDEHLASSLVRGWDGWRENYEEGHW